MASDLKDALARRKERAERGEMKMAGETVAASDDMKAWASTTDDDGRTKAAAVGDGKAAVPPTGWQNLGPLPARPAPPAANDGGYVSDLGAVGSAEPTYVDDLTAVTRPASGYGVPIPAPSMPAPGYGVPIPASAYSDPFAGQYERPLPKVRRTSVSSTTPRTRTPRRPSPRTPGAPRPRSWPPTA
jgi:hypothetical protein